MRNRLIDCLIDWLIDCLLTYVESEGTKKTKLLYHVIVIQMYLLNQAQETDFPSNKKHSKLEYDLLRVTDIEKLWQLPD